MKNMIKKAVLFFLLLTPVSELCSQIYVENTKSIFVIGSLREEGNLLIPVRWAKVELKGMNKQAYADGTGYFAIDGKDLHITSLNSLTLIISADGYETTEFSFTPEMQELGVIFVRPEYKDVNPITVNDLMPDRPEINGQTLGSIGAAALFWNDETLASATNLHLGMLGFKMRGYEWRNTEVYVNGAAFNDPEAGYAFAGLLNGFINIAGKNTGSSRLINDKIFYGDIGGYSHIELNPLRMYPRKRVSYTFSNSLYSHSLDAMFSSGEMASGWALGAYLSSKIGEGFIRGTKYEEISYLFSAGKTIDDYHSFSFFAAGSPTRRGLANYSAQSVYDQKNDNYHNSAWGYANGLVKNSRQNIFHQPLLGLSHEWEGEISSLNTSVLFSTGNKGETGLNTAAEASFSEWTGAGNNQALHSQIVWDSIYSENTASAGGRSKYILDNNSSNRTMISLNSVYDLLEWGNLETTAGIEARLFFGRYCNKVYDLLGGSYWLNIDKFLTPPDNPDFYQFDMQLPDRNVPADGMTGHDYSVRQQSYKLWNVWRYYMRMFKFSLGASASYLSYGYTGNIKNGKAGDSGTKQPDRKFFNWSGKAGVAYKLASAGDVEANVMYSTRAPLFSNAYLSPRISGTMLPGLRNEKILATELNYTVANTVFDMRASAFFTKIKDRSVVASFYDNTYLSRFDMGLTKLSSMHVGGEVTARFSIIKGLKADFAASYGLYKYVSDPYITLLQENINETRLSDTARMKGLALGNTPQLAITAGGIYESPLRFWLGFNLAFAGQSCSDINPVMFAYSYREMTDSGSEQLKLKGALTFNLKGGYVFVFGNRHKKALSLNIHAQNLFGSKGILGAYSPPGMENSETRYAHIYGRTVFTMLRFSF
ncbi:MAG: TonB-dependent receptor [Prevotellaceae bacterium]|nr:TonB-dependent receptor [Prevotellaceae bacterium]